MRFKIIIGTIIACLVIYGLYLYFNTYSRMSIPIGGGFREVCYGCRGILYPDKPFSYNADSVCYGMRFECKKIPPLLPP